MVTTTLSLPLLLLLGTVVAAAVLLALTKLLQHRPVLGACFVLGVVSLVALFFLVPVRMDRATIRWPSWTGLRSGRVALRPPAPPAPAEVLESPSIIEPTEVRDGEVIVADRRGAKHAHRAARGAADRSHDRAAIGDEESGEPVQLWWDPAAGTIALRNDGKTINGEASRWATGRWYDSPGLRRVGTPWNLFFGLVIAAFLYVGYLFLDTSTRGHFTWSLRVLSIVAFAALCVLMAALRQGF